MNKNKEKSAVQYALEAEVAFNKNEFKYALELINKALLIEKDNDIFMKTKTNIIKSLERKSYSVEKFSWNKKFLQLFNRNKKPAIKYAFDAYIEMNKRHFDKALKLINKALILEQNNDIYLCTRCYIKLFLRDFKGAKADIDKALTLNKEVTRYKKIQNKLATVIH